MSIQKRFPMSNSRNGQTLQGDAYAMFASEAPNE